MSKFADPTIAHVWLDGDAFRGVAGAEMPTDPFADTLTGFDAFGGIEAGFEVKAEQSVNKVNIFNYRGAPYGVVRDPLNEGLKFRAVDNSKATALTRAQGGKVTKKGELYIIEKGIGEEFSLLVRLDDGDDRMAIWCPRATLQAPATRANLDGKTLDGWDFDVAFLEPPKEILPTVPKGMTID